MSREMEALAHEMAAADFRETADVLDRVRDQIERDDVDGWNALVSASFHLRVEASRRTRARAAIARQSAGEGEA